MLALSYNNGSLACQHKNIEHVNTKLTQGTFNMLTLIFTSL